MALASDPVSPMKPPPAMVSDETGLTQAVRLNLGGRETRLEGFFTVDLHSSPTVDIVADCSNLSPFQKGAVEEIYASNILEHFPHTQTLDVLKEWHRVLKKKGKLWISVPDFDEVVRLYLKYSGLTPYLRNVLYGDQIYDLAFHYTIFTFPTLAALCMEAGFEDIKRHKFLPQRLKDCSRAVNTVDSEPECINVEVTK